MSYIITRETLNIILEKIKNNEILNLKVYKDIEKDYYLCEISLNYDKKDLDGNSILKAYSKLNDFYILYVLCSINEFEFELDLSNGNYNLKEDYNLSKTNIAKLKDAIEHLRKAEEISRIYNINNTELKGIYIRDYKYYKQSTIGDAFNKLNDWGGLGSLLPSKESSRVDFAVVGMSIVG